MPGSAATCSAGAAGTARRDGLAFRDGDFGNPYTPEIRAAFQIAPVKLPGEIFRELTMQSLGIMVVDDLQCLAGLNGVKAIENQWSDSVKALKDSQK